MNAPTMLIFPRPELEAGNLAPLLRRFAPDKLPVGKDLASMMNLLSPAKEPQLRPTGYSGRALLFWRMDNNHLQCAGIC